MPIVNYVREHIRFMEYATDEHLSGSERLLWYALMHIMNQRAQGNIWPDEFIRISNDRLLAFCPMKIDTMATARNNLKQRGLIDYLKGEKNKKSPAYRMIYFCPQYIQPETERDGMPSDPGVHQESKPENSDCVRGKAGIERCNPQSNTEKSYYMGGNMGDNMGYKLGDNPGGNMGDIYNKHIRIQERIQEQETETVPIVPQRDFRNQSDMQNLFPLHPPLPENTEMQSFLDEEDDENESDCKKSAEDCRNMDFEEPLIPGIVLPDAETFRRAAGAVSISSCVSEGAATSPPESFGFQGGAAGRCGHAAERPVRASEIEEKKREHRFRRARSVAETAWQEYIGTRPTPAFIERLVIRCSDNGFDPDVLERAIQAAGENGASNPSAYVNSVLDDWFDKGLKTGNDVFYYMGYREEISGRWDVIGPFEAQRRLDEFLEKIQERNARGGRENVG